MNKILGIISVISLLYVSAFGKTPRPYSLVTTDYRGHYYFKMIVDSLDPWDYSKAHGICYKVERFGNDKLLWKTKGWYSRDIFLSIDGAHLISVNWIVKGTKPKKNDVGIAFYHNGILIKSISPYLLVKKKEQAWVDDGFYCFINKIYGFYGISGPYFAIQTVDSLDYIFDMETGELITDTLLCPPPSNWVK